MIQVLFSSFDKVRVEEGYLCSFSSHEFQQSLTSPFLYRTLFHITVNFSGGTDDIHSRQVQPIRQNTLSPAQFTHSTAKDTRQAQWRRHRSVDDSWVIGGNVRYSTESGLDLGRRVPACFGIYASCGLRNALMLPLTLG